MLEVECISDMESLKSYRTRWDNLLDRAGVDIPYFNYEWYSCALKTIDRHKRPLLLFFVQDGIDVGLVPLVYKEETCHGIKYFAVSFNDNPYTPFQGFVYITDYALVLKSVVDFLLERLGSLFVLNLDEMRLSDKELRVIRDLEMQGLFLAKLEEKSGSRYLMLGNDFEHTVSCLKKKTQKEFRRKIRRLSGLGKITLFKVRGNKDIGRHLDRFFYFYARTWKGAEPEPDFYYLLCRKFNSMGRLHFYALEIDGEPVAYLICISGQNVIYGIKTTYNPSYYAFSPGVVLFHEAIRDMFNVPGIEEFDIGRGHEQFKREWTSLVHPQCHVLVYPNRLVWRVMCWMRYNLLPAVRGNEKADRLYLAIKALLARRKSPEGTLRSTSAVSSPKRISCSHYRASRAEGRYEVRFAQLADTDRLVVAMAAKNVKSIRERLEHEQCILMLRERKIHAYFWLSPEQNISEANTGEDADIEIKQWGICSGSGDNETEELVWSHLCRFIETSMNRNPVNILCTCA